MIVLNATSDSDTTKTLYLRTDYGDLPNIDSGTTDIKLGTFYRSTGVSNLIGKPKSVVYLQTPPSYNYLRREDADAIANSYYQAEYTDFKNFMADDTQLGVFPPDLVGSRNPKYNYLRREDPDATANLSLIHI